MRPSAYKPRGNVTLKGSRRDSREEVCDKALREGYAWIRVLDNETECETVRNTSRSRPDT